MQPEGNRLAGSMLKGEERAEEGEVDRQEPGRRAMLGRRCAQDERRARRKAGYLKRSTVLLIAPSGGVR